MDHEEGGAASGMGVDSRSEMSGSEAPSRVHTPTRYRSSSRAASVNSASAFSAHTTDVEIASTVDHNHHPRHSYRGGRTRRAGSVDTIKQSEDNESSPPRQRSILSISGSTPRNTLWNRSMNQLLNGREEGKEGWMHCLFLSMSTLICHFSATKHFSILCHSPHHLRHNF